MKKLAIVALGPSASSFDQKDFTSVWAINNAHDVYGFTPTKIIALDDLERDVESHPKYVKAIVGAGVPVLTTVAHEKWQTTEPYPLKKVIGGLKLSDYLASKILINTCCYTLALAIVEGFDEISLYGYDFVKPDETRDLIRAGRNLGENDPPWIVYYRHPQIRKPTEPGLDGVNFLLGLAHGRGLTVNIENDSTLLDFDRPEFFYGYQAQPLVDIENIWANIPSYDADIDDLERRIINLRASMDD